MKPNLSSLSENEINSGKIWTLLRYSKRFEEDINWFSSKYRRSKSKRTKQENREKAISDLHIRYEEINRLNPFAGTALQWMFPMPIFINEDNCDTNNHPLSWGPYIYPKKGDKIDVLKEWNDYENAKDYLTLKTDWFSVNEGFKRNFMFQHRQLDSRPVNPITKNRSDSPIPHESDFFDDLDLTNLINEGPTLTEEGIAKVLYANDLKNNYRVLAVPRHLHTKKAIDDAMKPIINHLKAKLPKKASEPLGTIAQWSDFMDVKNIQHDQDIPSEMKAIHILIRQRHSKKTGFKMREARRSYEKEITKNVNSISSRIDAFYPIILI
tara:strand:- start:1108 stop:2079 length:972 start_codon:yes stop_codon:yes gene_type:complete